MHHHDTIRTRARLAGVLYLLIILLGLGSELGIRQPLLMLDGEANAARIATALPGLRLGLVLDAGMIACDVALAMVLFQLLRPAGETLAMIAAGLRLVQTATIAAALQFQIATLRAPAEQVPDLLELQSMGYDFGLIFFAINTLLTALLLARIRLVPPWLCWLLALAGLVYLFGSLTRFLAPGMNTAMQSAYVLPMVAESAFCLWLLLRVKGSAPQSG
jgi:hypothetical protein